MVYRMLGSMRIPGAAPRGPGLLVRRVQILPGGGGFGSSGRTSLFWYVAMREYRSVLESSWDLDLRLRMALAFDYLAEVAIRYGDASRAVRLGATAARLKEESAGSVTAHGRRARPSRGGACHLTPDERGTDADLVPHAGFPVNCLMCLGRVCPGGVIGAANEVQQEVQRRPEAPGGRSGRP